MSSKIKIVKICEYCSSEFIAKKTITKCCSEGCAKRFYKLNKRNAKISQAELKTEILRKPNAYITEQELKEINTKEYLTLKEAALLVNVSPLTFRRWILGGKISSNKIGKKHLILRSNLVIL